MAAFRNKRKLATVTRETHEEHPRNGQSRNTSVPRLNEEYITQASEEIGDRGSEKLSQEFRRTESRILGALSKLDEFLLNPHIRTHSGTVPGIFRNKNLENQEPNEDRSQDDPHPGVGSPSISPVIQMTQTQTRLLTILHYIYYIYYFIYYFTNNYVRTVKHEDLGPRCKQVQDI